MELNPDTLIFPKDGQVLVHAKNNPGFIFREWAGALAGQQNPQTLTITNHKQCIANYATTHPDLAITSQAENKFSQACIWGDYDNDGDLDLFVANDEKQQNQLFQNDGHGNMTPIVSTPITNGHFSSISGCWGDYDNDGDLDLFVVNKNGENNQLFNNTGSTFTEIMEDIVVQDGGSSTSACWGDYDNDGYLDLFVTNKSDENNYLYHNQQGIDFIKIEAGDIVNNGGDSRYATWGDYDGDNDLDLFVANTQDESNFLYSNNGDGTFSKIIQSPVTSDHDYSWSANWIDFDNDRDLDLFVANANQPNRLYKNNEGLFQSIEIAPLTSQSTLARGSGWGDFDCDGDLDLFINNRSEGSQVFLQNEDSFTSYFTGFSDARGGSWQDWDNDGDLDLAIAQYGAENLFIQNNSNEGNWLKVFVRGSLSNKNGIGTKIQIKTSEGWQLRPRKD